MTDHYGFYLVYTIFSKSAQTTTTVDTEAAAHKPSRHELYIALGVLIASTLAIVLMSELLVAVQVTLQNKMDLSIGIAVGSGLQIALFVAPELVLVSQFVGPQPMSLVSIRTSWRRWSVPC